MNANKSSHLPFADDAASFECAGLTVENGTESIALYGQAELTKDKAGLKKAEALLDFAQRVVEALRAESSLPDAVPPPKKAGSAKNPFS